MNILHLLAYSLYSGPVAPTLGLALAQRRAGHTVTVACDRKRGNFDGYEEAALPRLEARDIVSPLALTLSTKSSPFELMRDIARLRSFLNQGSTDLVHVHMSHDHTMVAVARQGLRSSPRVVRTFHASRSLEERFGQGVINRAADGWITRNQTDHERALSKFALPPEKARMIPGSIESTEFVVPVEAERVRAKQELGLPTDAVVIGHVALIANRGQEELLDALAMTGNNSAHVLFVGRGEAEPRLRNRVEELGLKSRVHFTGYLKDEALLRAYAALDTAFVAGPGNDASMRGLLEAMSTGLPVLGVSVGAVNDVLTEDFGYPVDDLTPASVAEGLRLFFDDENPRARGERGRSFVVNERTFDCEWQKTEELYRVALS
ncbi:MAG: glycosyltransferase family 4 protein [Myxococcota bacterium]